jgi:hypothetical protein
MVAKNDITGDAIQTKSASQAYYDNYDLIFRKKNMTPKVENMKKGTCGCGRSPTGDCCGWHALTEEQYQQRKEQYETGKVDLGGQEVK